jgi:Asp-tRNA(Asn)/Glu-tRNA(Gln) amidotransferase A subunit family amidase
MADSAAEVLRQMDLGAQTSTAHVTSLLEAVQVLEPQVQAWAHLNPAAALAQARACDARRSAGHKQPLLGLAVGLKDIIDTADMPTENGTVLHAGRRPTQDAALVTRLRQSGAVILGKTVTTELATYAPGKTRNPHRLEHTPGGSSSGSAAAVACGMVPLAIGSQTNGSTIRPGAFCGVVSFKPTRSSISRTGMLVQSPSFDTVGLFARQVSDVALLWRVLADPAPSARGHTAHEDAAEAGNAATAPRLVWMPGPFRDRLEPGVEAMLLGRARSWGAAEGPSALPCGMQALVDLHRMIMEAEIAQHFAHEYATGAAQLSASLRGQIERGRQTSDAELVAARSKLASMQSAVDAWMQAEAIDGWVTASAPGPAPLGLQATGDPIFCTAATALDLPALQIPGLTASNGLPLGIQVVGRRGCDARLLALASRWLQP